MFFQLWYCIFYFEQLKLLLMSACVLIAEQRSGGAHFSQRLGCGTALMSGISILIKIIYLVGVCVYVCVHGCLCVCVCSFLMHKICGPTDVQRNCAL